MEPLPTIKRQAESLYPSHTDFRYSLNAPNFFVEFDSPVPFKDVAKLAVHTLAEILDVPHPGRLADA